MGISRRISGRPQHREQPLNSLEAREALARIYNGRKAYESSLANAERCAAPRVTQRYFANAESIKIRPLETFELLLRCRAGRLQDLRGNGGGTGQVEGHDILCAEVNTLSRLMWNLFPQYMNPREAAGTEAHDLNEPNR